MAWIPTDSLTPAAEPAASKGKWVPTPQFSYDPAMVQKYEAGGLQQPTIDPVDLALFAATGGISGAGEAAAKEGTSLLAPAALKAGLRTAAGVGAAIPLAQKATELAEPAIQQIPGKGPLGQITRGVARQAAGIAPFVGMAVAPSIWERTVGRSEIAQAGREAATEAEQRQVEAERAQATVAEARTEAETAANQDLLEARSKFLAPSGTASIVPEAREETIRSTVGAPSGLTSIAQGPERIERTQQFRENMLAPLRRWRDEWATRRDEAIAPFADKPVDNAPLRETVSDEMAKWQPGHAPYSPKVLRLLSKTITEFEPPTDRELLTGVGYKGDEAEMMQPTLRAKIVDRLRSDWEAQHPPEENFPTVRELLGTQSEANQIARASKGADRTAALRVVHGVDETLAGLDMPALKSLNAEYADHRLNFPYRFEDTILGSPRPVDAAPAIFNEPQRALDLLSLSNEPEKAHLRQLYADWVDSEGTKVVSTDHAPILKAMGYKGPLANPKSWIYEKQQVDNLAELFDTSPAAGQKFAAALQREAADISATEHRTVVKAALQQTRALGPVGQAIRARIDDAPTLEAKAQVAVDAFKELQPESPTAAAVKAIQEFVPKDTGFRGYMKRYVQRMMVLGPIMAMAGRPYFLEVGAAGGGALALGDALRAAARRSLQDPDAALKFWQAVSNPGVTASMDHLAEATVAAALGESVAEASPVAAQAQMPAIAVGIRRPGSLIRGAQMKRAEAIAGPGTTPEKVDHIKGIDAKVRSGKTPNVHNDLRTGRISTGHVRKMVEGGKASMASVFEGLSPSDAIEVLAKASPQEKELFLPIVVNKIHTEGSRLPRNQQMMLIGQLRAAMGGAA